MSLIVSKLFFSGLPFLLVFLFDYSLILPITYGEYQVLLPNPDKLEINYCHRPARRIKLWQAGSQIKYVLHRIINRHRWKQATLVFLWKSIKILFFNLWHFLFFAYLFSAKKYTNTRNKILSSTVAEYRTQSFHSVVSIRCWMSSVKKSMTGFNESLFGITLK